MQLSLMILLLLNNDMKYIYPDLSKTNNKVKITNYFQLETLVKSAYSNDISMYIDKDFAMMKQDKFNSTDSSKNRRENHVNIDLSGLDTIEKVYTEDKLAIVNSGIKINELNKQLKEYGLMFPIALQTDKTVMEVINENLLLANSFKDGSVRSYIEDITLMTPSSKLVKTGNRIGDNFWYGYNMKDLIVGSWYSLGFTVQAVLKLKSIDTFGTMFILTVEDDVDYLDLIKHISKIDTENDILSAIRVYNKGTYVNPTNPEDIEKKALVLYTYSKTKDEQQNSISTVKSYLNSSIKTVDFEYDQSEYVNLTKTSIKNSDYFDWYVPLSKVGKIMNELPELESTPYEIHLVNSSAILRIYPGDNNSAWLDRVTSKIIRYRGVLNANKGLLDKADPNLISRLVGSESEEIQKEIKRLFDEKDLLEPWNLYDITKPTLIERIKGKHPVWKYIVECFI